MRRPSIPVAVEQAVLQRSKRRCALCWGLDHNLDVKDIQIAHVDGNRSNNAEDNLAALCQAHHNSYDSKPSQTKQITRKELKQYRDELYDLLERKSRSIQTSFLGPRGQKVFTTTDAQRLGQIVEAVDEDTAREHPNGIRLCSLAKQFYEVDGDLAAGRTAMDELLKLAETHGEPSAYLTGQNELPVPGVLVSLIRALRFLGDTDGMAYVWFLHEMSDRAFYGSERGWGSKSIAELPAGSIANVAVCLYSIARTNLFNFTPGMRLTAADQLCTLACKLTIAYSMQGRNIPERIISIFYGHGVLRVAPGLNFIGNGPRDEVDPNAPPDIWFSVMHWLALLDS